MAPWWGRTFTSRREFMNLRSVAPCLTLCVTALCTTAVTAHTIGFSNASSLDREINSALRLEDSWHARIRVNPTVGRDISIAIPFEGMTYTLELSTHSVRDEDYKVFMQDDEGELYEVPASPVRTMRGTIAELPGSMASATLMEYGLVARIRLADGQEFWMEPVGEKIGRENSNLYAFYKTADIISSGGVCAAEDHQKVGSVLHMLANYDNGAQANRGGGLQIAQLGVDTDYEYYQDWGSGTETRINSVINSINQQYESDVSLRHEITTIIVRSSSNDPYTSTDAETLLDQFGSEWNSNQSSIPRDVAHLFTGKSMQGSTIGIAWLGVVCYTSSAYGLVESDCCGSFGCTTDLSAHEIGHNWNAGHVNSPAYNTMYPSLQCANLFVSTSVSSITAYANSVNCLSNGDPLGACCISGNQCIDTYESTCLAGGGTYQGDNTSCGSADCSEPMGACCVNGSCYDYTQPECSSAGGSYAGDGSDCSSTGCSLGACCVGIDCSETLLDNCAGSWYGDNTTCADTSCGAGADQLNYELRTWSRSDGSSMETYDMYFPSSDANSKLVAVFGEDSDLLQLRSLSNADFDGSASLIALHQSVYGSDGPHDRLLDAPFGDDLVYDSYVTVGSDDSANGEPLFLGFDSAGFNSSAGVEMDNGIWFVIPDDPSASIGAGTALGHRLLSVSVEAGQGVEMLLNIQWFDGADVVHETRNIYWNNEGLGGIGNDCPTDLDGSGSTDVGDVLEMIGQWGACSGCSGDLNGDGSVNVTDLLQVIGAWGACSEPETFNVAVDGAVFSPSILDVRRGDTIIWTRIGGNHTVTSGDNCTADGLFDAPLDNDDPVFTWVVPSNAPTFIPYFCIPHCNFGQEGEINVID